MLDVTLRCEIQAMAPLHHPDVTLYPGMTGCDTPLMSVSDVTVFPEMALTLATTLAGCDTTLTIGPDVTHRWTRHNILRIADILYYNLIF